MEHAWVLVGMMGAGKTTIGRLLAERSGRPFFDTDVLIQQRLGRTIPQIFQLYGEEAFRDHETSILRSLQRSPSVVSTGGGIVMRPENWQIMRSLGVVVYLKASLEVLVGRLETSKKRRPLLDAEDWVARAQALLEQREPLYEQADVIIEVGAQDISFAMDAILDRLVNG